MFAFRSSIALALTGAPLAAAPASAQGSPVIGSAPVMSATDGRWLANACASTEAGNRSFCYGYILGMTDQLVIGGAVCRPATLSGEKLVNLVRSHLAASPSDLQRHASYLVRRVLAATHPCRR
jgi:hypothetical protein